MQKAFHFFPPKLCKLIISTDFAEVKPANRTVIIL